MDKSICKSCCKIYKLITEKGFCRKCDPERESESKLEVNLDNLERADMSKGAVEALSTRLKVVRSIPRKLNTLWSKAVTKALLAIANAKAEGEGRLATERFFKLKGTLVMPLRSGKSHRRHSIRALEKRLWMWIEGKDEEVWEVALQIEKRRSKKRF